MPKYPSKHPPKPSSNRELPDRDRQSPRSPSRRDARDPDAAWTGRSVRSERRQQRGRPSLRLPAEEAPARYPGRGRGHTPEQSFKCGHCKRFVGPLPSGGHQRNHCPFCLYSRHVDDRRPGDRASACNASMEPIGAFQRPNGEHCVVHRCLGCGFERFNRIGADDDFDLVLSLPVVPPRSARPGAGDAV
jgi:RNHCP domain